jgi:hypothetical protein
MDGIQHGRIQYATKESASQEFMENLSARKTLMAEFDFWAMGHGASVTEETHGVQQALHMQMVTTRRSATIAMARATMIAARARRPLVVLATAPMAT